METLLQGFNLLSVAVDLQQNARVFQTWVTQQESDLGHCLPSSIERYTGLMEFTVSEEHRSPVLCVYAADHSGEKQRNLIMPVAQFNTCSHAHHITKVLHLDTFLVLSGWFLQCTSILGPHLLMIPFIDARQKLYTVYCESFEVEKFYSFWRLIGNCKTFSVNSDNAAV